MYRYLYILCQNRKRLVGGVPKPLVRVRVPDEIRRVYHGTNCVADGVHGPKDWQRQDYFTGACRAREELDDGDEGGRD